MNTLVAANRILEGIMTMTTSLDDYENPRLIRDVEDKLNKHELNALKSKQVVDRCAQCRIKTL